MIDVLAIGAHPDDVELCAGGTLLVHKGLGQKTGIIDLTRGEMGTRGTPEIREKESQEAARILGLTTRENLGLPDVFFLNDEENKLKLVQRIRELRPKIVLANAEEDRHPDHGKASQFIEEACFWAGLVKIETTGDDGQPQQPHRPDRVYHYIQSRSLNPDFYVDISDVHDERVRAYKAYESQLHSPNNTGPETYISSKIFLDMLEARAMEYGSRIGVKYAEAFTTRSFSSLPPV